MINPMHHSRLTGRAVLAAALVSAAGLTACNQDKLLTVPTPDVVLPKDISGPATLPNAYASAIGDFQVAYAGAYGNGGLSNTEGQVLISGLLSDELFNAETFTTRIELDRRATNPLNASLLPIFQNAQRARATAELVSSRYRQFDPTNLNGAEIQALSAYTYVLLAENYCNGVPTSTVKDDGSFVFGAPQTGQQLLQSALAKYDSAITLASTKPASVSARSLYLARIGKGRTLLDLNRVPEAVAAVASVPTDFEYLLESSENSGRQNNAVFNFTYIESRFTVGDAEGGNGIPFVSLNDPRVPTFDAGLGFDNVTELFLTTKFPSRSAPTPLALGVEARLIEAEAAQRSGDLVTFRARLNQARAGAQTYPNGDTGAPQGSPAPLAITDIPATPAGQVDLLFRERALNLYLTSHRLGDLRRLIWQYGRNSESVFPTGPYTKTDNLYGTDVNLPIPSEEQNNPEYAKTNKCINRSAGIT